MTLRPALGLALLPLLAPALPHPAAAGREPPAGAVTRTVRIRGTEFTAELAVTAAERARGLMERDELAEDRAMLFVFPGEGRPTFWMKNTRIELDIVYIGADLRIVSIVHRAQPCRAEPCEQYAAAGPSAYALELAGGVARRLGLAPGDTVELR